MAGDGTGDIGNRENVADSFIDGGGGFIMARTVAIGEQDFGRIIERDYFYIDKTDFIKDWWDNGDTVTLITRPRRFGKTLTMSMMEHFFSIRHAGRSDLFEGSDIWKEERFRKMQGTYPVIFLSFAGIKDRSYEMTRKMICQLIINIYSDYHFLIESEALNDEDKAFYKRICIDMDDADIKMSLSQMSGFLYKYYGKKVILLLDEYDTPMQEAYMNGYWDKLAELIRGLFHHSFKTNGYLERGIMTGITRVSRESIFSDLNNLAVITAVSRKYADVFGFTEEEVLCALEEYGQKEQAAEVKRWYDGYRFGDLDSIYNPWSITQFLDTGEFKLYWANTSSNRLVGNLIRKSDTDTKMIVEDLLHGGSFCAQIDEEIIFSDLERKKSAVWGLLLAGGYFKILRTRKSRRGMTEYELALTNREVRFVFDEMAVSWFSNNRMDYSEFSDALMRGDIEYMNEYLNAIAYETFSFFDTGSGESKQSENFYHGFILGLIADLRELYRVTSNRESGNGRYDVLLEPYEPELDDGLILEFKVFHPNREKSLKDTVRTALKQIINKKYAAMLETKCSRDRIKIYGIAFKGKEILIDGGNLGEWEHVFAEEDFE